MSANFIVRYAGAGVKFYAGALEIVDDTQATRFSSHAEAWHRAQRAGLPAHRVEVVGLTGWNNQGTKEPRA